MNARVEVVQRYENLVGASEINIHATALALTEIGIGNTLHALHVPFAGTILSLNQIFLLTRSLCLAPKEKRTFSVFSISACAALFKCLVPFGKKLTPMLAICLQGLLYNLGIFLFGNTLIGRLTGGILSSFWGVFQPLLLYWLLFGSTFFQTIHRCAWMEGLFFSLLFIKIIAASLIVFFTTKLPLSNFERYLQALSRNVQCKKQSVSKSLIRLALSDLCKPLFLFSLLMTALFFYFSEGISCILLWVILRPLATGFFFFFLLRLLPLDQVLFKKHNQLGRLFKNLKALIGE